MGAGENAPTTADPSFLFECFPLQGRVIVVEMPAQAPVTPTAVITTAEAALAEMPVSELRDAQHPSRWIEEAELIVGRWGAERGDAEGGDLGATFCLIAKWGNDGQGGEPDGRALVLDGTLLAGGQG